MAKRSQGNSRRVKMIPLMSDKIKELEKEIASLKEQLEELTSLLNEASDIIGWSTSGDAVYRWIKNNEKYQLRQGERSNVRI